MDENDKLDLLIKQNSYILGLLESNSKTGQKGAIERLSSLENRVDSIEITDKVRLGKVTAYGGAAGIAGSLFFFLGKIIFKFLF